jgi:hypothetical protein
MLQKSSSAHGLRAYYHSFLPVQMECHKHPLFARVNDGPCNFVDVVCDFSAVCNVRV